jgi:hypothetical protein
MTYYEQDELALLLMMVESSGNGNMQPEAAEDSVAQMLYEPEETRSWYVAPGRRYLPAELGGRVAQETPPRAENTRRGDLLREFGAGQCVTEFSPLQFDHKTLTYTGTIYWDTRELGEMSA